MISVTATGLRNNLFNILDKVTHGETVSIKRHGEEIARILPIIDSDWRANTKIKPKLLASQQKAFAPIEDIWENYI